MFVMIEFIYKFLYGMLLVLDGEFIGIEDVFFECDFWMCSCKFFFKCDNCLKNEFMWLKGY